MPGAGDEKRKKTFFFKELKVYQRKGQYLALTKCQVYTVKHGPPEQVGVFDSHFTAEGLRAQHPPGQSRLQRAPARLPFVRPLITQLRGPGRTARCWLLEDEGLRKPGKICGQGPLELSEIPFLPASKGRNQAKLF